MLSASIDIGSNTLRLLVGRIRDNRIEHVFSDRRITRLAEGIEQTGCLRDENIEVSINVLREFSFHISRYGVKNVRAVATSALREASNSDEFIQKVSAETGIMIEVISGKKEAELILQGILLSFPHSLLITHRSSLIIDIGGGSTEWILCRGLNPVDMGSMPLGVIKLYKNFIKTDPIAETDVIALNREICLSLGALEKRTGQYIDRKTGFIGTAGTFTTLASIDLGQDTYVREKIHLHRIPLMRLRAISNRLLALPLQERRKVRGLEPQRADLIIPGIQFTINLMEFFHFDELLVSDYGLLEGALIEAQRQRE